MNLTVSLYISGDFSVTLSRGYIIMPVGDKWLSLWIILWILHSTYLSKNTDLFRNATTDSFNDLLFIFMCYFFCWKIDLLQCPLPIVQYFTIFSIVWGQYEFFKQQKWQIWIWFIWIIIQIKMCPLFIHDAICAT